MGYCTDFVMKKSVPESSGIWFRTTLYMSTKPNVCNHNAPMCNIVALQTLEKSRKLCSGSVMMTDLSVVLWRCGNPLLMKQIAIKSSDRWNSILVTGRYEFWQTFDLKYDYSKSVLKIQFLASLKKYNVLCICLDKQDCQSICTPVDISNIYSH